MFQRIRVESKAEKIKPSVREAPIQRDTRALNELWLKEKTKNMRRLDGVFLGAAMERCVQQNLYHERQMNHRAFAEQPLSNRSWMKLWKMWTWNLRSGVRLVEALWALGSPHDQKQEGDGRGLEQAPGHVWRWGY